MARIRRCDQLGNPDENRAACLPTPVKKIKAILAALEFADDLAQVATMPGWKLHPLRGDRKGEYSISVTGNWRITFRLQGAAVTDVNFEDYH
jgi:proteic killer suppression protein